MKIDEWTCELDSSRKEVILYQDSRKAGSYRLIVGLESYCTKCMHPCVDEKHCRWHFIDEQLDRTLALDAYWPSKSGRSNLMTSHIIALKSNREYAKPLSCAMSECLITNVFPDFEPETIDYIVPVPKHPKDYKVDVTTKEKYNQAEVLANYIAGILKIKQLDVLEKKAPFSLRNRRRDERRSLTKANYFVKNGASDKIEGRTIMIIDDVRTCGSTGDALASALKSSGADEIYLYVAARDVIPEDAKKCYPI